LTEIDKGVDCTRRLKKPRYRLRLERRRIYAEPDELLMLRLLEVPAECAASCYVWNHVRGGGILIDEVGEAVWYRAPSSNEGCKGSAIITVSCGEEHLDTVFIGSPATATPPDVLAWYRKNRTTPSIPGDYWKYRSYVIKSMTLRRQIKIDPRDPWEWEFEEGPLAEGVEKEVGYTQYVVATGDPLPEGVTKEPRARWPRDWKPGDPAPRGIIIPEGTVFPEGWSYYIKFPSQETLFLTSRSYDCNGIYLQTLPFARYNAPVLLYVLERALAKLEDMPLIVDARTPFLKGERVVLADGAIIPWGWKPNSRGVVGLTIPGGTIWPPDWKKGDAFPKSDCCPPNILEIEEV